MQVLIPKPSRSQAPFVTVPAGTPIECPEPVEWLSLDAYVATNGGIEGETLYVRVSGDSMQDRDIEHGDILVVHIRPVANSGEAILARLGGTFTIKNFHELDSYERRSRFYLVPSNDNYNLRSVNEQDDFEIVGVVAYVVKKMR